MEENNIEEIKLPEGKVSLKSGEDKFLVTSIVSEENNKEYFLYSDGNLYERDNNGKLIKVDNVAPESRKIVEKIMKNFEPGITDVVDPEKSNKPSKRIEVDYPEL